MTGPSNVQQDLPEWLEELDRREQLEAAVAARYLSAATRVPDRETPSVLFVVGQPGSGAARRSAWLHEANHRHSRTGAAHISQEAITRMHPDYHHLASFYASIEAFDGEGWLDLQEESGEQRLVGPSEYDRVHGGPLARIAADVSAVHDSLLGRIREERLHAVIHLTPATSQTHAQQLHGFRQADYRVVASFHAVPHAESRLRLIEQHIGQRLRGEPASFERARLHDAAYTETERLAELVDRSDIANVVRVVGDYRPLVTFAGAHLIETGPPAAAARQISDERNIGWDHDRARQFNARLAAARAALTPTDHPYLDAIHAHAQALYPNSSGLAEQLDDTAAAAESIRNWRKPQLATDTKATTRYEIDKQEVTPPDGRKTDRLLGRARHASQRLWALLASDVAHKAEPPAPGDQPGQGSNRPIGPELDG